MDKYAFGVWAGEGWMHCPLTGSQIRGSRKQMRQYARDMNCLTQYIRLGNRREHSRFVCRKIANKQALPNAL